MTTSLVALFLYVSFSVSNGDSTCTRHRKAWHLSTDSERQLFIDGLHELNDNGIIDTFAKAHYDLNNLHQGHHTSAFFSWHRYFIWEFESQIRALGEKYECFFLPYWDFSHEYGRENSPDIIESGIGGNGVIGENMCINGDTWSVNDYPTPRDCSSDEAICCIKRDVLVDETIFVPSYSSMAQMLLEYDYYGHGSSLQITDGGGTGFKYLFQFGYHANSHIYIGGGASKQLKHITTLYAPTEPIFYLIHSWVDFIWQTWMSCYGYSDIPLTELPSRKDIYDEEKDDPSYPDCNLHSKLLMEGIENQPWSHYNDIEPTVWTTFDNEVWDVSYQRGDFFTLAHVEDICPSEISTDLFPISSDDDGDIQDVDDIFNNIKEDNKYKIYLFEHKLYQHLFSGDAIAIDNIKDSVQSWHAHTCHYHKAVMNINNELEDDEDLCNDVIPEYIEKCDEKFIDNTNEIQLNDVLNKDGVLGNKCLTKWRTQRFEFMKNYGQLWQLCNGEVDQFAYCPKSVVNVKDDDIKNILDEIEIEINQRNLIKNKQENSMIYIKNGKYLIDVTNKENNNEYANIIIYSFILFSILLSAYYYYYVQSNKKEKEMNNSNNGRINSLYGSLY